MNWFLQLSLLLIAYIVAVHAVYGVIHFLVSALARKLCRYRIHRRKGIRKVYIIASTWNGRKRERVMNSVIRRLGS